MTCLALDALIDSQTIMIARIVESSGCVAEVLVTKFTFHLYAGQ